MGAAVQLPEKKDDPSVDCEKETVARSPPFTETEQCFHIQPRDLMKKAERGEKKKQHKQSPQEQSCPGGS